MKKLYVIKNTENSRYFTGDYDCFWSLDIKDAKKYAIIESLERDIEEQTNPENDLDSFEKVKCIIVETIYLK